MKCPDCDNGTLVGYFARMSDGSCKPRVEINCPRCKGTAEVPDAMADWITAGEQLRALRLSMGLGLRKCAEKIGVVPSELSFAEEGLEGPAEKFVGLLNALKAAEPVIA